MPEAAPGLLRLRLLNTAPMPIGFSDDFEEPGAWSTLWHSLGTEAGTDNSIAYWTINAGVPTYAAHVLTVPAAAQIQGGNNETTDCLATVRLVWASTAVPRLHIHSVDVNNYVCAKLSPTNFFLTKQIAGVTTDITNVAFAPVNGTAYWMTISAVGTGYVATLFADSAGAKGGQLKQVSGFVADAAVQSGGMGVSTVTAACNFGGAFANVCTLTGPLPDGWTPVVTTGEPAFATSNNAFDGVASACIFLKNGAGNGSFQQSILAAAVPSIFTVAARASAGTANATVGGLTTGNATSVFALLTAAGTPTANPTISLNYTGAASVARFDAVSLISSGTGVGSEITPDLPHPHQSSWHIIGMQPGNPSNTAIGTFSIPLHEPGSEAYLAAKPFYDQLRKYQRIEAYISHDGASAGDLFHAGVITEIDKSYGESSGAFINGITDPGLANYSRPFPGELLPNDVTSKIIQSYMGVNELGWSDAFNPYVPANYLSTAVPGLTSGAWSSTTDENFTVISCATGTGAILLSQQGAQANDRWHSVFTEVTGRLKTSSTSLSNAGIAGVGLSNSSKTVNTSVVAYVRATGPANSKRSLSVGITVLNSGVQVHNHEVKAAFTNVDDPTGAIPITISLYLETAGSAAGEAVITVNGTPVIRYPTTFNPRTATLYPFLYFGTPATSTATIYWTNFVQMTRFTADGPSTAAAFAPGSITASTNSLGPNTDPGANFLDVWTRAATRDGWYWRYTPQPYVIGVRTLGTVDYAPDPGTDYGTSKQVLFSRADGTLTDLSLTENADPFMTGTAAIASSTPDGGGIGYWRDIASMALYGVIEDHTLATANDVHNLRRNAYHLVANKIATDANAGSMTATIIRTTDNSIWRELDRVMIHDPELNVNYRVARVLAYTFDEGDPTQVLTLDQFGIDFTGQPRNPAHNKKHPRKPPHKKKK
jgi:hypothetical protein